MEDEMTIGGTLFDRVVQILEQARSNVVQSVNTNMVTAYWLIGWEIVIEVQCGKERAVYGKQVIEVLSQQLSAQYGSGFSLTNVKYFRQLYQAWPDRLFIQHPFVVELAEQPKSHPSGGQFPSGFSSRLSWSHYRALMRVSRPAAREFYEREAIECGWSKTQLERQIQTSYYEARQKHIRFDDDDFYVDLVFYNFILKCFLLIDLKLGKLTHQDVGQMDGYVRLFEDQFKVQGDNPTIGLILCSDKSEAVAKYSVLHESKQIFASKYLKFLPTEEELRLEIEKERRLIEASLADRKGLLSFDENSVPNAE